MKKDELIIFEDGEMELKVSFDFREETVWLSQKDMSILFGCSVDNIGLHLRNIFKSGELNSEAVTEESSVTAQDGKKYNIKVYNLEAIISVGYRINSIKGVKFRQWATKILKEYTLKGVVHNDKRLNQLERMQEIQVDMMEISE